MNTEKKKAIIWKALIIAGLVLSIICLVVSLFPATNASLSKYVLYIGTNDKDTNKAQKSFEECLEIVKDVCNEQVSGYTVFEATGLWHSQTGEEVSERTIVCSFDDITEEKVYLIADKLLYMLNQSSIMIEEQRVKCTYYYGEQ